MPDSQPPHRSDGTDPPRRPADPDTGLAAQEAEDAFVLYGTPLARMFEREGVPEADADDLTGDTITRVFDLRREVYAADPGAARLPPDHLRNLVFDIGGKQLLHYRRTHSRTARFLRGAAARAGQLAGLASAADRDAEDRSYRDFAEKALSGVSPEARQVYWMIRFGGMKAKEVAEATGRTESTIRTHLMKATKQLCAAYLTTRGPVPPPPKPAQLPPARTPTRTNR